MTELIRMQEVCKETGATHRALRVWEEEGLLGSVARDHLVHRRYTEAQVMMVRVILTGQLVGLTLDEIKEIAGAWGPVEERKMHARIREHIERIHYLFPPEEYDL